ncbi:MAG: IS1595 family transposase [Candidatus Korobacteraceae bacterium]|jgi:transposase-like protein
MKVPKTLQEAIQFFTDFDNCREFMIEVRWLDGKVRCPACGSEKITYLANARLYKCNEKHPRQKFSLKVGTVFEDSPIALEKWLPAVWMLCNDKNGVSSYEISRALGVTQKTAWFMLHRIRLAMQSGSFAKMGGPGSEFEADETFIGGKGKNMHKSRKLRLNQIRSEQHGARIYPGKTAVMGILDRNERKVRATVIPDLKRNTLQTQILDTVEQGSSVYTDEQRSYDGLAEKYVHEIVNHMETYVKGRVHTNGLENFWSLLKRGLNGTYVAIEPYHVFRYVDEQVFRYNNRATRDNPLNDSDRFFLAMSQIVGKRLTYAELTGKVGETTN